jgi:HEAT repeat protein
MQSQQNTPAPQAAKPARSKPPMPPPEFQERDIEKMDASALAAVLKDPNATEFQKAKACQRAAEVGATEAVPALAALLSSEHLNTYARYGLEALPTPAADDALRAALPKLKGNLLIGAVNSLGKRRDAKAVPVLSKLIYSPDAEVAKAAASAVGKISGPAAMKELQIALLKTKGPVRTAVADAGLLCAEGLMAQGLRTEAMALYAKLSAPDVPKPMRLAAMHGIIAAETSTSRPR